MAELKLVESKQADKQHPCSERLVLQGVPSIGFYHGGERCPEDVAFPACMRACLDFFGEGLGYHLLSSHESLWRLDSTYTFLMGVSGCAFHLNWAAGWQADALCGKDRVERAWETFARTYAAVGYGLDGCISQGEPADQTRFLEIIRASLWRGRPVIALGVIGPPEACLVTGFDAGGEVLIGWNFFQGMPEYSAGVTFEPTGEFRCTNWFPNTRALLVFGEQRPIPPQRVNYLNALHLASQVKASEAYQTWAADLRQNQAFPPDTAVLRERIRLHGNTVSTVAEQRWYAARFLEQAVDALAETNPAVEAPLLAASQCYDTEHNLMWKTWERLGGSGQSDDHALRLADPAVRAEIASLILQAGEQDRAAAGYIEQALFS